MAHLHLQPHVSFAIVDGRTPVFLDLRRDRYFALSGDAASAFDLLRRKPGTPLGESKAARLLATGLFATAAEPDEIVSADVRPARDRPPGAVGPAFAPADVAEIWWLLASARHSIRRERLDRIIERCRRLNARGCGRGSAAGIVSLANRFRRARAWVPIKPSCLQDSLALHRWLAGRGASAALVLGVKLNPFAAHCWVQRDGLVLNDMPETVSAFTPILAVGCS